MGVGIAARKGKARQWFESRHWQIKQHHALFLRGFLLNNEHIFQCLHIWRGGRFQAMAISGQFSLVFERINSVSRVSTFSHDGVRSYFQCLWIQLLVCCF
jgi:hypothetical protein